MLKKKYMLLLIILIIIGGIYFSLTYHPVDNKVSSRNDGDQPLADNLLKEINLTLYNRDKSITWKLNSKEVANYSYDGMLNMDSVNISAYDKREKEVYTISAVQGRYLGTEGRLNLSGAVKLKGVNLELAADSLTWDKEKDVITGSGGLNIRTLYYQLRGSYFETDPSLQKVSVSGNADKQACLKWDEGSWSNW